MQPFDCDRQVLDWLDRDYPQRQDTPLLQNRSRRQSRKYAFEACLKGSGKGKSATPKSHQEAFITTWAQPFQCNLRRAHTHTQSQNIKNHLKSMRTASAARRLDQATPIRLANARSQNRHRTTARACRHARFVHKVHSSILKPPLRSESFWTGAVYGKVSLVNS